MMTLTWRWHNVAQPFTIHSDDFCHLLTLARESVRAEWCITAADGTVMKCSEKWTPELAKVNENENTD